jgi:hypothetical protein
MGKKLDITGLKFGRLTAIKRNGFDQSPSRKHVRWDCVCDCGKLVNARLNSLRSGGIKSCGCLPRKGNLKHGMKKTKEYETWQRIKARCNNKNHPDYYLYGGIGINVCDRWNNSFENFYLDMGDRPKNKTSIERLNTTKGYSPENCIWADSYIQSRNKRNNRIYTFNNKTMCLSDWATYLGITFASLDERLKKWTLEKSLTTFKEN